jgi:hypothetical protein
MKFLLIAFLCLSLNYTIPWFYDDPSTILEFSSSFVNFAHVLLLLGIISYRKTDKPSKNTGMNRGDR